ncbi:MAG: choice-of-anchor tandem repeat NxxGxxAF-containing protein [Phycisphaerales bacterium]
MRTRQPASLVAIICPFAATFAGALAEPPLQVVVLAGSPAPGLRPATFLDLGTPTLNDDGRVAFYAKTTGNLSGIWSNASPTGGASALALVAQSGAAAPGGGAFAPLNGTKVLLSNNGRVAFTAVSGVQTGVWSQEGVPLALVAINGGAVPSVVGGTFVIGPGDVDPMINGNGVVAFRTGYSAPGTPPISNLAAIFAGTPSNLGIAAQAVMGTPLPEGFNSFVAPIINDRAYLAATGSYHLAASNSNTGGAFGGGSGTMSAVMLANQEAPGFGPLNPIGVPNTLIGLNNTDAMLFQTDVSGPGITGANETVLWVNVDGVTSALVREGDPIPGVAGVFLGEMSSAFLADSGHVVFTAFLTGPGVTSDNSQAIVRRDPGPTGVLRILARTGTQAPELQAGATILGFTSPAMNQLGQVAFQATVFNPGPGGNGSIYYGTDAAGRLRIAHRGNTQHVIAPGVNALVGDGAALYASGGTDGRRRSLNIHGEIAFSTGYTVVPPPGGGSAIFIARIPLPADINGDGSVNAADLALLLGAWGSGGATDLDGNGTTDAADLSVLLGSWS